MRRGWQWAHARWAGGPIAVLGLVAALVACARPGGRAPAAATDSNATPATAQRLALGTTHSDSLDRSAGDLDDWYRVRVPGRGTLRLDLSAAAKDGSVPQYTLVLSDETGARELARERAGGRTRIELRHYVHAGTYLIWVGSEPATPGPLSYELRSSFTPAQVRRRVRPPPVVHRVKPPPPPAFRVVTAPLVELENARDGGQTILLGAGEDQGLRPGLRGRVVESGNELGTFQVVDVYPHGCRVQVDGRLKGPVTQKTVAEIQVPVGGSGSGGD